MSETKDGAEWKEAEKFLRYIGELIHSESKIAEIVIKLRNARAQAWEEGFRKGIATPDAKFLEVRNPYRDTPKAEVTGEKEERA